MTTSQLQLQPPAARPATDNAARVEELGRIILAYSEITEKLEESHAQLTATVERLQRELSEKNRALERRNRLEALGEMAAGMAHEIRNPLAGIQLYASMLQQDLIGRNESIRTVEKIRAGVRRLEALVSQVLHFTREINAHRRECDLCAVIRESIELARARRPGDQIRIVSHLPQSLVAWLDPDLIGQATLNLLCNAIDAVGTRGNIVIELEQLPGELRLRVTDDGPGVAPELLDRIFNPFFTTREQGTGLGLAIVHRIVEAHDGTISVTNRNPGASFEMRLAVPGGGGSEPPQDHSFSGANRNGPHPDRR